MPALCKITARYSLLRSTTKLVPATATSLAASRLQLVHSGSSLSPPENSGAWSSHRQHQARSSVVGAVPRSLSVNASNQGPLGAGGMFVLGLTGSIGMGKSTVSAMFKKHGVAVMDADAVVHGLYAAGGGAVPVIREMFPGAVVEGAVDRKILSTYVLGPEEEKKDNMKRLEEVVHALVKEERLRFLRNSIEAQEKLVVLDVPLLFETKMDSQVDAVAVVSAGEAAQRERVLARPGMTEEKFENILQKQVPDAVKRERADFVLDTNVSLEETEAKVAALINDLCGREGKAAAVQLQQ